jgi:Mg2+-importing ATPase
MAHEQPAIEAYRKLDEIPFDFERRRLSIVVAKGNQQWLIVKGAQEGVLECCSAYEVDGHTLSLEGDARSKCETTYRQLSAKGLRVLAVAYRLVSLQSAYRATDEQDLVLLGFATFTDPPLVEAASTLQALRRDGVQVKILTGDNELVTRHVRSQVGLDGSQIVLGEQLDRMSDTALVTWPSKPLSLREFRRRRKTASFSR